MFPTAARLIIPDTSSVFEQEGCSQKRQTMACVITSRCSRGNILYSLSLVMGLCAVVTKLGISFW